MWTRQSRIDHLPQFAQQRILLLDGAMGTMIQKYKFEELAFRERDLPTMAQICSVIMTF